MAVAICLGVLAAAAIPAVMQLLQFVDGQAAYAFNRVAGMSPVFDRFVLLVADEDGRERVVALAAVWFFIAVWRAPTRIDKSRLLGTFFYVTLVLVLYFLVDSLLDDVIERKSPSMEFLQPFNDIGKILDNKVDVTNRRTFPNQEAIILFTLGFMLLRLGQRRGAIWSLACGMTVPLLLCVAGLSWVTDIYLGALPIAFLVSAIAVETPFKSVHGSMVELAAAGIDESVRMGRGLVPMWRHRRLYWISQNVFHMEVAVKRFAARELPAVLDPDKKLADQKPHVEVPLGGLRSVVRITTLGDKKAVVRAYPINRRFEAQQHYNASMILTKHGIRVPAILDYVDNPRRFGALFIVEEFVDGVSKRADELTEENLEAIAAEMARLHSVKAEMWGPLESPRTEDLANVRLRRIDKQLSRVARGPILTGQQAHVAQVRQWFASWRKELESMQEFCLVHGKLHRENVLFERDGRFCLLDTTTMEWGIAASDLVVVHYSQCGGREDLIEKVNAAYLERLNDEERERCLRVLPLFRAMYFLGQVQKTTKRIARTHKQPVGDSLKKGVHWWHLLMGVVEKNPRQ